VVALGSKHGMRREKKSLACASGSLVGWSGRKPGLLGIAGTPSGLRRLGHLPRWKRGRKEREPVAGGVRGGGRGGFRVWW
jgi:hypothetical protein